MDTIALLHCCECNFIKYCMFLNSSPFQTSATCYLSSGRRNMWFDRYASLTRRVKLFREWRCSSNCRLRKPQLHFCSSIFTYRNLKTWNKLSKWVKEKEGQRRYLWPNCPSTLSIFVFWIRGQLMSGTCSSTKVVNMAQLCFHQIAREWFSHFLLPTWYNGGKVYK